jgi:hypothetical protein
MITSLSLSLLINGNSAIVSDSISKLSPKEFAERRQFGRVVEETQGSITVQYLERYWTPITGEGNYFKAGRQLLPLKMLLLDAMSTGSAPRTAFGFESMTAKDNLEVVEKVKSFLLNKGTGIPDIPFLKIDLKFSFSPVGTNEKFLKNVVFVPSRSPVTSLGPLDIQVRRQQTGKWRIKLSERWDAVLQQEVKPGKRSVEEWCTEVSKVIKKTVLCDSRVAKEIVEISHRDFNTVKEALFIIAAWNDMAWEEIDGSLILKGANGATLKYEFDKAIRRDIYLVREYVGWLVKYKAISPQMGYLLVSQRSKSDVASILKGLKIEDLPFSERESFLEIRRLLPSFTRLCPRIQMNSEGVQLGAQGFDYLHIDGQNTHYNLGF